LGTVAGLLTLIWAVWRLRFTISRLRFRRRSGAVDPVRREAGRWLLRLQGLPVDPVVQAELERLRYGPATGRPPPAAVVRRARTAWKAARRVRTIPRS
jgi:ferric-dicitrate binding protein FerR (iron transport regulator)